jgi:hypothetical protein
MATTLMAAPIVLGVDDLHDANSLQRAFERFTLWGIYVRGGFFAAAFLSSVWALAVLAPRRATAQPDARSSAKIN